MKKNSTLFVMILKAFKQLNDLNNSDIYTFSLCSFVFSLSNISIFSQENSNTIQNESLAIENVIVEEYFFPASKYFLSTGIGNISKCNITYKIYIEMKPGCSFQLIYGEQKHELYIKTSTKIQNNTICRDVTGFNINPKINFENKDDSDLWITMGSTTKSHSGYLRTEKSDDLIINKNITQNNQNHMSRKLSLNKSFKFELNLFNDQGHTNEIYETNKIINAQTEIKNYNNDNKILIAQLTTKDKLNFELNIQSIKTYANSLQFTTDNILNRATQTVNPSNN
jgi:hypothetical protein